MTDNIKVGDKFIVDVLLLTERAPEPLKVGDKCVWRDISLDYTYEIKAVDGEWAWVQGTWNVDPSTPPVQTTVRLTDLKKVNV